MTAFDIDSDNIEYVDRKFTDIRDRIDYLPSSSLLDDPELIDYVDEDEDYPYDLDD